MDDNQLVTAMIGAAVVAVALDVTPRMGGWLLLVLVLGMLTVGLSHRGSPFTW